MKSKWGNVFNHDTKAQNYDNGVLNESHPVRTGYQALISYISAKVPEHSSVLDLGSGTGNTIVPIHSSCRITAVDISTNMMNIARTKLIGRNVDFINEDILQFVSYHDLSTYQWIVSTYAMHHLTSDERRILFENLYTKTSPDVKILIGDLMYKNNADRNMIIEKYEKDHPEMSSAFDEEFYWNIEEDNIMLTKTGWSVKWLCFSDLSWLAELEK